MFGIIFPLSSHKPLSSTHILISPSYFPLTPHIGISDRSNSDDGGNVPLKDHPPEVFPRAGQGVLGHNEFLVVVVPRHKTGIDVLPTGRRVSVIQNHTINVYCVCV